jgi:hypothetical protein
MTVTVTPVGAGEYSATLAGVANTATSILVTSASKTTHVMLSPGLGGVSLPEQLATDMATLALTRRSASEVELSGTFQPGHAAPFSCKHVETGIEKTATLTGDDWHVVFAAEQDVENTFVFQSNA